MWWYVLYTACHTSDADACIEYSSSSRLVMALSTFSGSSSGTGCVLGAAEGVDSHRYVHTGFARA